MFGKQIPCSHSALLTLVHNSLFPSTVVPGPWKEWGDIKQVAHVLSLVDVSLKAMTQLIFYKIKHCVVRVFYVLTLTIVSLVPVYYMLKNRHLPTLSS